MSHGEPEPREESTDTEKARAGLPVKVRCARSSREWKRGISESPEQRAGPDPHQQWEDDQDTRVQLHGTDHFSVKHRTDRSGHAAAPALESADQAVQANGGETLDRFERHENSADRNGEQDQNPDVSAQRSHGPKSPGREQALVERGGCQQTTAMQPPEAAPSSQFRFSGRPCASL